MAPGRVSGSVEEVEATPSRTAQAPLPPPSAPPSGVLCAPAATTVAVEAVCAGDGRGHLVRAARLAARHARRPRRARAGLGRARPARDVLLRQPRPRGIRRGGRHRRDGGPRPWRCDGRHRRRPGVAARRQRVGLLDRASGRPVRRARSRGPRRSHLADRGLLDQLGIEPSADTIQTRPAALNDLVRAVYGSSPLRLATFAPLAFADPDDEVSARIVDDAVAHLARALLDIADPDLSGPLVIGGGVAAQPRVRERPPRAVADRGISRPRAGRPGRPRRCRCAGAAAAGVSVDEPVFARLQQTTAQVRAATDA